VRVELVEGRAPALGEEESVLARGREHRYVLIDV